MRDRVGRIEVCKCPIYFQTGEYDWSTAPQMSKITTLKMKGVNFKAMEQLDYFLAIESSARFVSSHTRTMTPGDKRLTP